MLVYIKGLPSSHEPYFAGKKRRSVLMVQVGRSWRRAGAALATPPCARVLLRARALR